MGQRYVGPTWGLRRRAIVTPPGVRGFSAEIRQVTRSPDQVCNAAHEIVGAVWRRARWTIDTLGVRIRCLSVHAAWACRHSGACCRAGWAIPIEGHLLAPLRAAGLDPGTAGVVPRRPGGECAFFEAAGGRLCAIHRRGGPALLPSACRHFPRVVVIDARGASVTLSHFCPTAAALLFDAPPLRIVEAPPRIALDDALEGLDATDVLPPLLSPGLLVDWAGYSAWEEEAVALFDADDLSPEDAVATLAAATDAAARWTPGARPFASFVRECFAAARVDRPRRGGASWGGFARAVNAYLAAHAFASWAPHGDVGLRAIPAAVSAALLALTARMPRHPAVTRETLTSAIRDTDLQLRHGTAARA